MLDSSLLSKILSINEHTFEILKKHMKSVLTKSISEVSCQNQYRTIKKMFNIIDLMGKNWDPSPSRSRKNGTWNSGIPGRI